MRFRPGPLRQSAVIAAAFVAARVVYYAIFAGASGGGVTLISLPLITPPAPFDGVHLLGPVTSGGLAAAALSALPFAAVIVVFGALNAFFDVRMWLAGAARRGPARSLSRALAIALQTVPELAVAVRRARRAAQLRGERPGASALVPVLEGAIERAVALAGGLELRGFAAARRLEGDCAVPVQATDARLSRPGWSLAIPSLALAPGTLTVLAGPTGSGKSSVLDALSGLFQHVEGGRQSGRIEVGGVDRLAVPPRETAGFVAAVAQRVRLAFVGETAFEEIGFALTLRGVAPVIVAERVREVAERLGISHLVSRPITQLSAGEAQLVALAAALVERPTLLLVDEPLAELDATARPQLAAVLAALAHDAGVCVVVAEHRTQWFDADADAWLSIADGELRLVDSPPLRPELSAPPRRSAPGRVVAAAHRVSVRHGERCAVEAVSLELHAGELVALTGPNGAGKSSLLGALALPGEPGRVIVDGNDVRGMTRGARHAAVALVPEDLEDLFVTDSVRAECRRADRHAARWLRHPSPRAHAPQSTLSRFGALLGVTGDALADVHPRDLSGGQRMCLAIALQLAGEPAVLLVDEPVRGLDALAREQLAAAMVRAADAGAAVLFATHEHEFAAMVADRTLRLESGRLVTPDGALT